MKLSEEMKNKTLLSFELFPPKTEKGLQNLPGTIDHLMKYNPSYISCTYGAGGGNVGANREVCQMIKNAGTTPVTHFTVIKNTKEGIKEQLDQYLADGVDHMLALRGDIPLGETTTCGDFDYATDLVKFVRDTYGDKFEIAVAGSPEGHISCRSLESDIAVLKQKQDNGADYIMTQLCWDMEQFKYWLDAIRKAGITMPETGPRFGRSRVTRRDSGEVNGTACFIGRSETPVSRGRMEPSATKAIRPSLGSSLRIKF